VAPTSCSISSARLRPSISRAVVSTGGDVAIVGLAGGALPVGFGTVAFDARVTMTFWGRRPSWSM
jgi:hypothetical protein